MSDGGQREMTLEEWVNRLGKPHLAITQYERLLERVRVLEDALKKLEREASGFVKMADPANHGHTNIEVMNHWIQNAHQALAHQNEGEG